MGAISLSSSLLNLTIYLGSPHYVVLWPKAGPVSLSQESQLKEVQGIRVTYRKNSEK